MDMQTITLSPLCNLELYGGTALIEWLSCSTPTAKILCVGASESLEAEKSLTAVYLRLSVGYHTDYVLAYIAPWLVSVCTRSASD